MRATYNPNLIAGKPATQAVRNPGEPENNKVLAWNNALKKWDAVVGGGGGNSVPEDYNASITNLPPTTYGGNAPTRGCTWYITNSSAADGNGDVALPQGALLIYLGGSVASFSSFKLIQA